MCDNIYANPLTPRALELVRERDQARAENTALRESLERVTEAARDVFHDCVVDQWIESALRVRLRHLRWVLEAAAPGAAGE